MSLLWLFLLWPVLEIALFIKVGGALGILPTLLLIFGAGAVGVWLVRMQGLMVINDLRGRLGAMNDPSEPMAHGALIALAGFLFMVPGFLSDFVALTLLFPPVRRWLIRQMIRRANVVRTSGFTASYGFETPDSYGRDRGRPTVIDAEFYEVDPDEPRLPPRPHRPSGWTQGE